MSGSLQTLARSARRPMFFGCSDRLLHRMLVAVEDYCAMSRSTHTGHRRFIHGNDDYRYTCTSLLHSPLQPPHVDGNTSEGLFRSQPAGFSHLVPHQIPSPAESAGPQSGISRIPSHAVQMCVRCRRAWPQSPFSLVPPRHVIRRDDKTTLIRAEHVLVHETLYQPRVCCHAPRMVHPLYG